jgi:putative phosphoribosyl transferase
MNLNQSHVQIPISSGTLDGDLSVPDDPRGLIIFAHGSGSGRFSRRNKLVATFLNGTGFATLLLDLLTPAEEKIDERTMELRFDIPMLASRVVRAIDWATGRKPEPWKAIGLFGASTGAAAALIAAAERPEEVDAVVSRGGRPDLAGRYLRLVRAPTLLIVGGADHTVIDLNEQARTALRCEKRLSIVPRATHLFEEPNALESVAALAGEWFRTRIREAVVTR